MRTHFLELIANSFLSFVQPEREAVGTKIPVFIMPLEKYGFLALSCLFYREL